jgi:hypothetical protein
MRRPVMVHLHRAFDAVNDKNVVTDSFHACRKCLLLLDRTAGIALPSILDGLPASPAAA